jgi:hypothetical protein
VPIPGVRDTRAPTPNRSPPVHDDPSARPDDRPQRVGVPAAIHATPSGSEDLQHVLKMIASSTDARRELVADIRGRVASGDYVTEDKLNLAIYRLLKDILD